MIENFDISQRAIGWKTNQWCKNFASSLPSIDYFFFDDSSSKSADNRSRASSSLSSWTRCTMLTSCLFISTPEAFRRLRHKDVVADADS